MSPRPAVVLFACFVGIASLTSHAADGPADNDPQNVRRVPPLGIELSPQQTAHLVERLAAIDTQLARAAAARDVVDVEVLVRSVRVALEHREFFHANDLKIADHVLDLAEQRLEALVRGDATWDRRGGLTALGFRSRLDDTVQPYGLVIPASYDPASPRRWRLDIWFHGRGETVSELRFIDQRLRQPGQYTPEDTIVLHPYGRYSNAFKFAGEVDVWEAIEDVQRRFRIDEDRIAVRGFSMGGAACWQFAVHWPDRFFAANPGAGFAETPEFLKFFQQETLNPSPFERTLWHWYDCTDYAVNLFHLPTVAYSGEIDKQKQAADIMADALARENLHLLHLIGPNTAHKIHPETAEEIEQRMTQLAKTGRDRNPRELHFQTWTLKYNRIHWLTIDRLQRHWERTRVDATSRDEKSLQLKTLNVDALTIDMPAGGCWLNPLEKPWIEIDGQRLDDLPVMTDRSLRVSLVKVDGGWRVGSATPRGVVKGHDLQGPIDDAFMNSFLLVAPTHSPYHPATGQWAEQELKRAREQWRQQFRGDARLKNDADVTEADIQNHNLVLFGDPQSNQVLKAMIDRLPLEWNADELKLQGQTRNAEHHMAAMIFPNPLNPARYVVLNSGFTYREYDYLNNARQTPKLPDWAIIDITTPPGPRFPGKIAAAGFFNEQWE